MPRPALLVNTTVAGAADRWFGRGMPQSQSLSRDVYNLGCGDL